MLEKARPALLALATSFLAGSCGAPSSNTSDKPPPTSCPAWCAETPPPLETGRLPDTARPLLYKLELDVDPAKTRFSGRVKIVVNVSRPTRSVVLHAAELDVRRASALTTRDERPATITMRRAASRTAADELVLGFDPPLDVGPSTLDLSFTGAFGEGNTGLFRLRDGDADYAFTQFEPADARRAFPCFDEPTWKTFFELAVTVPKGSIALSNGAEISREASQDGLSSVFRFALREPLPTYLVALAVGPLEVREGPEVRKTRLRMVAPRGKTKLGEGALRAAGEELRFLETYFQRPYPYGKLDLVAIPGLSAYAMEHPGLVTFREDLVLQAPGTVSAAANQEMKAVVAHELAHQWFGNLVTLTWWDELWLNEGLATWMEGKVLGALAGTDAAAALAVQKKYEAMAEDELEAARAVRAPVTSTAEAEEIFDAITYDKGAAVASMLEAFVGEDVMQRGLAAYLAAYAHRDTMSTQLFDSLGKASQRDVAALASPFLDRRGVPLVRAALACEPGKTPRADLSLDKPAAWKDWKAKDAGPVVVPVCVRYDGGNAPVCGALSERLSLDLPSAVCPSWVHPNAGERGYFRFVLSRPGFAALVGHASALSAVERTGLVANTRALVLRGEGDAEALVDLCKALRGERHPAVLGEIAESLRLLEKLHTPAIPPLVSSIFAPLARELGWEARPSDDEATRLARALALEALGTLGDEPWILEQAEARAAAYLADPRKLDPDTTPVALLVSARRADEARFLALARRLKGTADPATRTMIARGFGALGDPALFGRALDLALVGDLSAAELVEAFIEATRRPASLPLALAWLDGHFREVRHVVDASLLLDLAGLAGETCDPALRDASMGFFTAAFQAMDVHPRRLAMLKERADRCILAAQARLAH